MMKSSTMFLLLVSFQALSPSCSFFISPVSQARSSSPSTSLLLASTIDSRLFYRDNGDFDNENLAVTSSFQSSSNTVASAVVAARALSSAPSTGLSPLEVPARSDGNMLQESSSSVADRIEMTLGRVAMVAAVIFLGTELITGQSLPEQIITFFSQQH